MTIAVFMDERQQIESFIEGKYLGVFTKADDGWKIIRKIQLKDCTNFSLREMREYFNELTNLIADTKVVVSKEAYGIPYNIFYSKDFSIWEMKGDPYDFLEQILIREIEHENSNLEEEKDNNIIEIEEGKFFIDLIKLQNTSNITSKQAMLPFLQNKVFNTLEVQCCHIPPWFNKEKNRLGFNMEVHEVEKDNYKVILKSIK